MVLRILAALALLAALTAPVFAQHYQSDFPPEEFRTRWQKVFEKIGNNAVAVLQGMPKVDGFIFPRQYNSFYYLCGIETPGAYLLLDGRTKKSTVYLPPRNAALEQAEGRILSASDADLVKRLTGVDEVQPLEAMAAANWPSTPVTSGPRNVAIAFVEFSP